LNVSDALESQLDSYATALAEQIRHVGLDEVVRGAGVPAQLRTTWPPLRRRSLLAVLTVAALVVATLGTLAVVVSNNSTKVSPAGSGPVVKVAFSVASMTTYGSFKGNGRVMSISCAPGGQTCMAAGEWTLTVPHKATPACPAEASCSAPLVLLYAGGTWEPAPPPTSPGGFIRSVSCPSALSCDVVVSGVGSVLASVLEHFNGSTWSMVPLPSDLSHKELVLVACPTVNDCYLAGLDVAASGGTTNSSWIAQQLDGRWRPVVNVSDLTFWSLSCQSPTSCWAVGSRPNAQDGSTVAALQLVDGSWHQAELATPPGSLTYLEGIACANLSFCVAVGDAASAHLLAIADIVEVLKVGKWDFAHGPPIAVDQLGLFALACGTRWGCIAVGGANGDETSRTPEILAVAASGWRQLGSDLPSYGAFVSLSCALPTKCFTADGAGIVSITAG
jgi:hypothetical protein